MPEAYIYDHVRTPRGRGKADGALHEVTALALATVPLQALKERNNLAEDVVDDVILGVVDPVGEAGSDIARFAALKAGLGESVPGVQISRFCASGLDAVNFAAAQIMAGQHELVIGGGAESMSRVGIGASGGAWPMDPSMAVPSYFMPQGVSADLIATKYGFSRDDVDAYAVQSQQRAAKAWDEGRFDKSVVPVKDINGLTILARDEHMRPTTTMQSLGQLQPSFVVMGQMGGFDAVAIQSHPEVEKINYVHHAGNSSGIVDGAGAVLLGSKEAGAKHGLKPRAKIRAFANIGSEPAMMLTGPVDVTEKLFERSGMKKSDIDLFELNEAFAGGAALHAGLRDRSVEDQRQWRRDRARPSTWRHGSDDSRHRARRAGAHQQVHRAGDALHRRRHGDGDDHRKSLGRRFAGWAKRTCPPPRAPQGWWWARRKRAFATLRILSPGARGDRARKQRNIRERHQGGFGKMVTLEQRYAGRAQNGEFVVVFDALSENGNIKRMRNADNAGHDHLLGAALIDIAQQLHVDLDQVRLKPRQQTQTGISGAEIIQRGPEAQLAIRLDDPLYMGRIRHLFVLGEFEHQVPVGEPDALGRGERFLNAGCRLIHRVGHEVDREPQVLLAEQPAGSFDRHHPGGLVEPVAQFLGYLAQDRISAFTVHAPHQGFVAPDAVIGDIDDRLERHLEFERKSDVFAAADTDIAHGATLH